MSQGQGKQPVRQAAQQIQQKLQQVLQQIQQQLQQAKQEHQPQIDQLKQDFSELDEYSLLTIMLYERVEIASRILEALQQAGQNVGGQGGQR